MAYLCKVVIDSVTVRDDSSTEAYVTDWEYEKTTNNSISELTINVLSSTADVVSINPGKTVEVWTGFSTSTDLKIFSGFISESTSEGGSIELICKDKLWDLIRKNVNTVYESSGPQSGQISAIAKDLIETHGGLTSAEQATGTSAGETLAEFRCDQTDVWERLIALAQAVNYQIFYDAVNDTVHFEPKGFADSGETITVGTEILGVPKWTNDTSRMINDLRVDGAVSLTQNRFPAGTGVGTIGTTADFDTTDITLTKTPESVELIMDGTNPPVTVKIGGTKDSTSGEFYYVDRENKNIVPAVGTSFPTAPTYAIVNYTWFAPSPIHQINQSSIDTYGTFQKQITLTDIQTVADGESRTAEILSKLSTPFLIGDLLVKQESTTVLAVGDRVVVVDAVNKPNINQELVITQQTIKYPGANQEIIVGDESMRLKDWQINVENRIKRIEEQLSLKNQDLILELRDFQNTLTFQPRYRQVTTRDTSTDTIWARDNWNAENWDGSYANSEVDHFIQQYQNSYTEDFIDTDFEGAGTATGWTTGSLDFTSGQIGLSKSVDFNNGTITTATLTSTEVSGSFTYALSADGGSNFETVTSGSAHTFTNTGTDLRWKATENAASTGEISKVEVTSFH